VKTKYQYFNRQVVEENYQTLKKTLSVSDPNSFYFGWPCRVFDSVSEKDTIIEEEFVRSVVITFNQLTLPQTYNDLFPILKTIIECYETNIAGTELLKMDWAKSYIFCLDGDAQDQTLNDQSKINHGEFLLLRASFFSNIKKFEGQTTKT